MLITSSIFDNRVLYSEPVKYIAKLRDVKEDDNEQLLKCKMEAAGHGGMSGRDNAIKELHQHIDCLKVILIHLRKVEQQLNLICLSLSK